MHDGACADLHIAANCDAAHQNGARADQATVANARRGAAGFADRDILINAAIAADAGKAGDINAMQAVRELGVELNYNVRMILGTDEESGSGDIAYYYAREPYAPSMPT